MGTQPVKLTYTKVPKAERDLRREYSRHALDTSPRLSLSLIAEFHFQRVYNRCAIINFEYFTRFNIIKGGAFLFHFVKQKNGPDNIVEFLSLAFRNDRAHVN